jgi:hypothetical protein
MADLKSEYAYENWLLQKEFEEDQIRQQLEKFGTYGKPHETHKQIQPTGHDPQRAGAANVQQGEGAHLGDGAAQQPPNRPA